MTNFAVAPVRRLHEYPRSLATMIESSSRVMAKLAPGIYRFFLAFFLTLAGNLPLFPKPCFLTQACPKWTLRYALWA